MIHPALSSPTSAWCGYTMRFGCLETAWKMTLRGSTWRVVSRSGIHFWLVVSPMNSSGGGEEWAQIHAHGRNIADPYQVKEISLRLERNRPRRWVYTQIRSHQVRNAGGFGFPLRTYRLFLRAQVCESIQRRSRIYPQDRRVGSQWRLWFIIGGITPCGSANFGDMNGERVIVDISALSLGQTMLKCSCRNDLVCLSTWFSCSVSCIIYLPILLFKAFRCPFFGPRCGLDSLNVHVTLEYEHTPHCGWILSHRSFRFLHSSHAMPGFC